MCPDTAALNEKIIAILGWGSLLWEIHPEFDKQHREWQLDGPMLKLEFSRKSKSRNGALTLVIDRKHGQECQVAYAVSQREKLEDTICDLRSREGTTSENIGYFSSDGPRHRARDQQSLDAIRQWAAEENIHAVVWTDLGGSFNDVPKEGFVRSAIQHLQGLPLDGKANAAEYIWRAPKFVATALRTAIQVEPWFQILK
jgi:hypothetical protein